MESNLTNYDILNKLSPAEVAEGLVEILIAPILESRLEGKEYTEEERKEDRLDILKWLNSPCDEYEVEEEE